MLRRFPALLRRGWSRKCTSAFGDHGSQTFSRTAKYSTANDPNDSNELRQFRLSLRRFVDNEVLPYINEWEENGAFPRSLYKRVADLGVLGIGFPVEYGGTDTDCHYSVALCDELGRCASGGLMASFGVHAIALPPLLAARDDPDGCLKALREKIVPEVLSGEKIAALGITEPGGGSDVASLKTTARRDGDQFVISGEKYFITSGVRADYIMLACRTGGPGAGGISMIMVPGDTPGLTRTRISTTGWRTSDTAALHFNECRVPVSNRIGAEGEGFKLIMHNFNKERFSLAASAVGLADACLEEADEWARERVTFGQTLISHKVIQHKLIDMRTAISSCRAWLNRAATQLSNDHVDVADICMLKNHCSAALRDVVDHSLHILGGAAYVHGCKTERVFRDMNVYAIGGGATAIMKDLAFRQLEKQRSLQQQ